MKGIYVIIDTGIIRSDPVDACVKMIEAGVQCIQLRAKNTETSDIVGMAARMAEMSREAGITFIVNDRVDVALAAGCGVHLGQRDMPADIARRLLGSRRTIGLSAGNIQEIRRVAGSPADYAGIGPVFKTETKKDAGEPAGFGLIRSARKLLRIPVVAIGGIKAADVGALLGSGADAVAVSSAVITAEDMKEAARQFVKAYRSQTERNEGCCR